MGEVEVEGALRMSFFVDGWDLVECWKSFRRISFVVCFCGFPLFRVWVVCTWNPNGAPCFDQIFWPSFGGWFRPKIEDIHSFQVWVVCTQIFNNPFFLSVNWVVVSNILYFHPYVGKIPILTNIFQMGWNHQDAPKNCWAASSKMRSRREWPDEKTWKSHGNVMV